jgi:ribosome-associated GTPase EngA
MTLPLVAIVGRPNVGKSTLYNKLVGGRPALVHDTPGLTRDRRYGVCDYFGQEFRVVDTGGLDPEAEADVIGAGIHRQAERAIAEAEVVLFVVDGKAGVSPLDAELGRKLRTLGKPLILAVNKIDHPNHDPAMHEFRRLGFPELFAISAAHGRGIDELTQRLVEVLELPPPARMTEEEREEEERKQRDERDAEDFEDDDEAGEGFEEDDEAGEGFEEDDEEDAAAEAEDDEDEDQGEEDGEVDADEDQGEDGEEDGEVDADDVDEDDADEDDADEVDADEVDADDADDDGFADEGDELDAADEPRAEAAGRGRGRGRRRDEPQAQDSLDPRGRRFARGELGPLRIAFVGRPNAGKSSLCNRLIGEERSLVHHVAGTTTDPVDSEITLGDRRYVIVDTAGIRRKSKVEIEIEKIAVSMALGQIERADVVVLLIDAAAGPSEQDARLAGMIEERGKALILAINKADLVPSARQREALTQAITDNFHFLAWAPVVWLSAARGDGVDRLLDKIDQVAKQFRRRIPTAELNRFFAEVCEAMPPPIWRGKSARVYYLTQGRSAPPTFLLWTNNAEGLPPSYRRFVANRLRDRYGFLGTPLRVISKSKSQRDDERGRGSRQPRAVDDEATRPPRPGERTPPRRRVRPVGPDASPGDGRSAPRAGARTGGRAGGGAGGGGRAARPGRPGRAGGRKRTGNKAGQPGGVKMGRSGTPRAGKPGKAARAGATKRPATRKAGRPAAGGGGSRR